MVALLYTSKYEIIETHRQIILVKIHFMVLYFQHLLREFASSAHTSYVVPDTFPVTRSQLCMQTVRGAKTTVTEIQFRRLRNKTYFRTIAWYRYRYLSFAAQLCCERHSPKRVVRIRFQSWANGAGEKALYPDTLDRCDMATIQSAYLGHGHSIVKPICSGMPAAAAL